MAFTLVPLLCIGLNHMSAPYVNFGTATVRYSCHISLVGIPMAVFERRWICRTYSVPFAIVYAVCSFQVSSWSTMIPRKRVW